LIPAFAIRFQGKVYAYQNRCAHMAVELDWQHGQFFDNDRQYLVCSTHGALYHPDTGTCAYGRCDGRSLISVDVEESDGRVSVISENGIHLTNDNQQITPET
jgi:nitrite reductase/ring-hydroxylating ferredoxin subunit